MKKSVAKICVSMLLVVFALGILNVGGTNSFFTDSSVIDGNKVTAGNWDDEEDADDTDEEDLSDVIVLNEILPNPHGTDSAAKPDGEWIELYNLSETEEFDLVGYYLLDEDEHKIDVESCRTDTGGTIISPKGFLVVYVKGDDTCNSHGFSLNNGGDAIQLYDGIDDDPLDEYSYSASEVSEGKSIARIPDGTGDWKDPIPTPGKKNRMKTNDKDKEEEENDNDKKEASTVVDADGDLEEILEEENPAGEETAIVDDLEFGVNGEEEIIKDEAVKADDTESAKQEGKNEDGLPANVNKEVA